MTDGSQVARPHLMWHNLYLHKAEPWWRMFSTCAWLMSLDEQRGAFRSSMSDALIYVMLPSINVQVYAANGALD